jgi:hypothetical protein
MLETAIFLVGEYYREKYGWLNGKDAVLPTGSDGAERF